MDAALVLEEPYGRMLSALCSVQGYGGFLEFLARNRGVSDDWRAEVMALFESHKPAHPLERICSHEEGEPEGILNLFGRRAIIEAAYVHYEFDTSPNRSKKINIFKNGFRRMVKPRTDGIVLVVCIPDISADITEGQVLADRRTIATRIGNGVTQGQEAGYRWALTRQDDLELFDGFGGSVHIGSELWTFDTLIVLYPDGGATVFGSVLEFISRVKRTLRAKRRQHAGKYGDAVKLFYLLLGCPDVRLRQFKTQILTEIGKPRNDEIVVLSTLVGKLVDNEQAGYGQYKLTGVGDNLRGISLDLSNRFIV